MSRKTSGKRIALKVVLLVFGILVLLCLGVLLWQKDNITALVDATKYSQDDIQQQMADNKAEIAQSLEEYNAPAIRDFTPEEEEKIRRGELSVDEAVARILEESGVTLNGGAASDGNSYNSADVSDNSVRQDSGAVKAGRGNVDAGKDGSAGAADIVSEYAVKMYKLKAEYLGQIGNLVEQAKADKKNGASLKSLASKYLSRAASLESQADSEVEKILSELSAELKAKNASTAIVDTMRSSYRKEKSLKKSYYLSLYESKK